jgi:hypothetical protein
MLVAYAMRSRVQQGCGGYKSVRGEELWEVRVLFAMFIRVVFYTLHTQLLHFNMQLHARQA